MTNLERSLIEFHDVGTLYLVDPAGNIHALTLPQYASLTAAQLRGASLFLTHAAAVACAATRWGRS